MEVENAHGITADVMVCLGKHDAMPSSIDGGGCIDGVRFDLALTTMSRGMKSIVPTCFLKGASKTAKETVLLPLGRSARIVRCVHSEHRRTCVLRSCPRLCSGLPNARSDGIRVVYRLQRTEAEMLVVAVGVRADSEVYREAVRRRNARGL